VGSESKWVENVFEKGFLGTGADIAARLPDPGQFYLTNVCNRETNSVVVLWFDAGTGIWREQIRIMPDGDVNFPYGFTVEPP
jgi:hypothetical protein